MLCSLTISSHPHRSLQVRRVEVVFQTDKVFLDASRRDEAVEYGHTSGLVVRPGCACTSEGLLPNDCAGTLLIVIHVAGGVTQPVRRAQKGPAVLRETGRIWMVRVSHLARFISNAYMDPVSPY